MLTRSNKFTRLEPIEPRIAQFIADRDLFVLRDAETHNALNVSYTVDGLKWTTNASGKLLYYENAKLGRAVNLEKSLSENEIVVSHITIVSTDGTLPRKSNKVYVTKFVPMNRPTFKGQIAEYTWVDKAYRLLTLNAKAFEA